MMQHPNPLDIRDAIRRALGRLGYTKDDVAASLLRLGIRGRPTSSQHCPLAHYLQEVLPDVHRIRVGSQAAEYSVKPNGSRVEVPLDPHLSAFVNDFDHRSRSEPYAGIREQ